MWLFHPAGIHVAGLGASCAEDQSPESFLVNLNAHRDTPSSGGDCTSPSPPLRWDWNWGASPLDLVVFPDSHPQPPERTPRQLGEQAHPPLYLMGLPRGACIPVPATAPPPSSRGHQVAQLRASSQGKTSWGSPGST